MHDRLDILFNCDLNINTFFSLDKQIDWNATFSMALSNISFTTKD